MKGYHSDGIMSSHSLPRALIMRRASWLLASAILHLCVANAATAQRSEQPIRDLRVDPLLLVSVKEYRHSLETIGPDIYPGWKWSSIPLLLYRPHVQDVLLNAPH